MKKIFVVTLILMSTIFNDVSAQSGLINGIVTDAEGEGIPFVNIQILRLKKGFTTNEAGNYTSPTIPYGEYQIRFSIVGFEQKTVNIKIDEKKEYINVRLKESSTQLNQVVVTGTMREVSKLSSPVPVDVYSSFFFEKNPTPSLFESLQTVNGVRPQLNCNICNTGDIHINGLEGPYTMVTIDGMPIVSGLSTVYGLNGIPNSLIERMEIVKGPASTLYGSEAVGGLINIITKSPNSASGISADVFSTSWLETNIDIGFKSRVSEKVHVLTGINAFIYDNPVDNNDDGFTDLTLAKRLSLFNTIGFKRKDNRTSSIATRIVLEDRWGGELNWNKSFRGSDSIYGESIITQRAELIAKYDLPIKNQNIEFSFSGSGHDQNSYYGSTPYFARQWIGFGQLVWSKTLSANHHLLSGLAYRYTYFDDNTGATALHTSTRHTHLPGLFLQHEYVVNQRNTILSGIRYDYNSAHGHIFTPRLNYKLGLNNESNLRISAGTGYRVANIFTEDHAALTGARSVVFEDQLKPELSYNINLNYTNTVQASFGFLEIDATLFYTYFTNKIQPDYDSDPNAIIYRNLDGFAVSRGISLNNTLTFEKPLTIKTGLTLLDVFLEERNEEGNLERIRPVLTERLNGTWTISYRISNGFSVDYSGNVYGPMRLPLLGDLDPRESHSPYFSIQNIKLNKQLKEHLSVYGGIKNLLNFTPPSNAIARSDDPFDKNVSFDDNGQVEQTEANPNALTFDPTYVYASNQGRRFFIGLKYSL